MGQRRVCQQVRSTFQKRRFHDFRNHTALNPYKTIKIHTKPSKTLGFSTCSPKTLPEIGLGRGELQVSTFSTFAPGTVEACLLGRFLYFPRLRKNKHVFSQNWPDLGTTSPASPALSASMSAMDADDARFGDPDWVSVDMAEGLTKAEAADPRNPTYARDRCATLILKRFEEEAYLIHAALNNPFSPPPPRKCSVQTINPGYTKTAYASKKLTTATFVADACAPFKN